MINESYYWKQPLLDSAQRLRELKTADEIDNEIYVQIEKDVFIGFYSIRKLLETYKVTDKLKSKFFSIPWHPHLGESVSWRNNHKFDELYDMKKFNTESRDIWFISSIFVHSFIFVLWLSEEGGLKGILVTSDKEKETKLFQLDIDTVTSIFEEVGNDNVEFVSWVKNPETGEENTFVS